jgi:hypothetical protein
VDIVRGRDPDDPSSKDSSIDDPFLVDISKLTVGYLDDAEMEVCWFTNFIVKIYVQVLIPNIAKFHKSHLHFLNVVGIIHETKLHLLWQLRLFMFLSQRVSRWFLSN